MIRHFFLDKTNTIVKDSLVNTGLNPVIDLNYGVGVSRALIHFDDSVIREMVEDKTIADVDKLTCTLKMTNCDSVDGVQYDKRFLFGLNELSERACSYDLILIKLPHDFDSGRGYDFVSDFWIRDRRSYSTQAANWYYSNNGLVWEADRDKVDLTNPNLSIVDGKVFIYNDETGENESVRLEGGVYGMDFIKSEYEKYVNGEDSIVIGKQHFDYGNENLSIDITKYVIDCLNGTCNYGLMLMFRPDLESEKTMIQQHAGFFATHTNTFFHPYVELNYKEYINDNRENCYIGRANNLYLYTIVNGNPVNLDNIPTCNVDGLGDVDVRQVGKGVYCAEIMLENGSVESDTILYDTWSNMSVSRQRFDDVEMEFVALPYNKYFSAGSSSKMNNDLVPSFEGINDGEKLHRGEIREVVVDFRKKYTTDKRELIDCGEYRVYTLDGNREVEVIAYNPIEMAFLNNFFVIYAEDFVPGDYYVDVRVKKGRETRYFKKALRFTIVSDVTERYE